MMLCYIQGQHLGEEYPEPPPPPLHTHPKYRMHNYNNSHFTPPYGRVYGTIESATNPIIHVH